GAVGEGGRAHELTTTADLHAGDAVLPALDEARQRELDRLSAVPARVELLAGLEVDTHVVHVDLRARVRLGAVADLEVGDDELGGGVALDEVDLGLGLVSHWSSLADRGA